MLASSTRRSRSRSTNHLTTLYGDFLCLQLAYRPVFVVEVYTEPCHRLGC